MLLAWCYLCEIQFYTMSGSWNLGGGGFPYAKGGTRRPGDPRSAKRLFLWIKPRIKSSWLEAPVRQINCCRCKALCRNLRVDPLSFSRNSTKNNTRLKVWVMIWCLLSSYLHWLKDVLSSYVSWNEFSNFYQILVIKKTVP